MNACFSAEPVATKSETKLLSAPSVKTTAPPVVEQKLPNPSEVTAAPPPGILIESNDKAVIKPPTKPATKSHKDGDGDSSATCSADEEPNLQDVVSL